MSSTADADSIQRVRRALSPLALHVLGELPPEARGNEAVAIFLALALRNPHRAGLPIDIRAAKPDQFRIADAGEEQQFQHHQVGQLARLPDSLVQGHQFGIGPQLG